MIPRQELIGNCTGCQTFPTVLFLIPSAWDIEKYRCASCWRNDVGHEHPNARLILENFSKAVNEPLLAVGKVHDKDKLFMAMVIGDAEDNKDKFSLHVSATTHAPLVISNRTGKKFLLSWQDILTLAKLAGISDGDAQS